MSCVVAIDAAAEFVRWLDQTILVEDPEEPTEFAKYAGTKGIDCKLLADML
jgi:hypothetical protein